jgi:cell division protein FtsB
MSLSPEIIKKVVSKYFDVPFEHAFTICRDADLVKIRQISIYFIKQFNPKMTQQMIGAYFPGKGGYLEHATIIHSLKKVNKRIEKAVNYKKDIESISDILTSGNNLDDIIAVDESTLRKELLGLRKENESLKKQVHKLQTAILEMKLVKISEERKLFTKKEQSFKSPFKELESSNNKPYSGYRTHQL